MTELQTQLSAYDPVIASLAKDVKSLEKSSQALTTSPALAYQQREVSLPSYFKCNFQLIFMELN